MTLRMVEPPVLPLLGTEQALADLVWEFDQVNGDAEILECLGCP